MQLPDLSELPPWAVVAFGISLAIIFGLAWLGERRGKNAGPAASAQSAQVAAVIVDPTALLAATAALEGHTVEQHEANMIARKQVDATEDLVRVIGALRDQLVHVAAKMG